MSKAALVQTARCGAERAGQGFKDPEDDWPPMLLLERGDGDIVPILISVTVHPEERAEASARLAREQGARRAVRVESSWMLKFAAKDPLDADRAERFIEHYQRGEIERDPERIEALFVAYVDAYETELWVSEIQRDVLHPPTLGEWNQFPGAAGLQIEPLQAALRETLGSEQ